MISTILVIPLITALIIAISPKEKYIRYWALLGSSCGFLFSLFLLTSFNADTAQLQFVEKMQWIPSFGIQYFVGIDGISLSLVVLTSFLSPILILGSWESIKNRTRAYYLNLMLLQSMMLGSFVALDMILFYCFWELSLIPMYFLIGIWGGKKRIYATIKFFIFTMFGSVFMLISIVALIFYAKSQLGYYSASILDFYQLSIPYIKNSWVSPQTLMFISFCLAFAIKVPMFPVHTWLPDAHTEAPTAGSVILAGVMLKMGTYGFLRFAIPMFPDLVNDWSWLFLYLGVIGVIYGSLVAMVQTDMKKLVAYSSVAHMGYVVMGMFTINEFGLTGSVYQMLNHGISTGALFLLVGMIYDRTHNRNIGDYGGLAKLMPIFTILFFIVTMSSIAVPGTNGFIGEYLILMGSFLASPVIGLFAITGVILGAVYMLWLFKRVFLGQVSAYLENQNKEGVLKDLSLRESIIMFSLVFLIFWMGIFPNHFLKYSKVSIKHLTDNAATYYLETNDAKKVSAVTKGTM